MGYVKLDTSDDIINDQNAAWLLSRARAIQIKMRHPQPLDFSVSYYIVAADEVPMAESPRFIVVTTIEVEGHQLKEKLAFYNRSKFAIALQRLVDQALHQAHVVNIALGDPTSL